MIKKGPWLPMVAHVNFIFSTLSSSQHFLPPSVLSSNHQKHPHPTEFSSHQKPPPSIMSSKQIIPLQMRRTTEYPPSFWAPTEFSPTNEENVYCPSFYPLSCVATSSQCCISPESSRSQLSEYDIFHKGGGARLGHPSV